jgi:predicted esterase
MLDLVGSAIEHTIETQIHGRYLVSTGSALPPRILIGFHGYAERAEEDLARLRAIPGLDDWTMVSVEALHHFYRRRMSEVAASWMTRQNRELAIVDNIAYVSNVVRRLTEDLGAAPTAVAGFSQGAAMAFRAAVHALPSPGVVISCGGDIPPDLDAAALGRIRAVLLGRGVRDEWYTAEKLAADELRLRDAGVQVQPITFDAGHEWTASFAEACSQFMRRL